MIAVNCFDMEGFPILKKRSMTSFTNMIRIRDPESYQETLQKQMRKCFLVCFGGAQMYIDCDGWIGLQEW